MSTLEETLRFFGTEGPLAAKFEGYSPRAGQVAIARDVADVLEAGGVLMAEGPTGTGKSLAYLVPAILSGKTVVVATANIALQEQLVRKDLPMLRDAFDGIAPVTFALAKGINNYLCKDREAKTAAEYASEAREDEMDKLLAWGASTPEGDVSELDFVPKPKNWRRLSVMSDECKGQPCKHFKACHGKLARARLDEAQIIVTNYHMLFAHYAVLAETGLHLVLPAPSALVLDEAHKAADIARDFFGHELRQTQVEYVARIAKRSGGRTAAIAKNVVGAGEAFFKRLAAHKASRSYRTRLRVPGEVDGEGLRAGLVELAELYEAQGRATSNRDDATDLKIAAGSCRKHANVLAAATALEDEGTVFYIGETGKGQPELLGKPIRVGEQLQRDVFSQVPAVVCTSATLAVAGSFDYVSRELGVEPTHEIVADSPFDWRAQVRVVVPKDRMPDLSDPAERDQFPGAMVEAVADVVQLARGRTLGLFTSHKMLDLAAKYLAEEGCPYRVLKQGDAPRPQLIDEFKRDVPSVLLGTESFWAGVDVPGEALSVVVIDKLPFPTPDDPILDALDEISRRTSANGRSTMFMDYSVPRAVIQLKQGVGRLIRAVGDRGVVVILDKRVMTKGYGSAFLKAIPPTVYSTDLQTIAAFLGESEAA